MKIILVLLSLALLAGCEQDKRKPDSEDIERKPESKKSKRKPDPEKMFYLTL